MTTGWQYRVPSSPGGFLEFETADKDWPGASGRTFCLRPHVSEVGQAGAMLKDVS